MTDYVKKYSEYYKEDCLPHALICKQPYHLDTGYRFDELMNMVYFYIKDNYKAFDSILNMQILVIDELTFMIGEETFHKIEGKDFQLTLYLDMLRSYYLVAGKQLAHWNFMNIPLDETKFNAVQSNYQKYLISMPVQMQKKRALIDLLEAYQLLAGNQEAIQHWYKSLNMKCAIFESMHSHCVIAGYEVEALWLMNSDNPPNDSLTDLIHQAFNYFYLPYEETKNMDFVTELIALCEKQ